MSPPATHRVVVVGGGFGGLQTVRGLRRAPVEITLVDRRNFHLFQPLLYQVATGALAAGEIATPLRSIVRRQANARVVLEEASGFDLEARRVALAGGDALEYDTLVVAAGAADHRPAGVVPRAAAPGLKSLEDALEIRARVLGAFEAAEREADPARRWAWLTFVVVGGGPTGVEVAGQIAEVANDTLRREFRSIDPRRARVLLVEGADRVLAGFPERSSRRAAHALGRLGVTPLTGRAVHAVDGEGVTLSLSAGGCKHVAARTVVWAAGVRASGLAEALAAASGGAVDREGRIAVGPDLTLFGHPEVLALGDMAAVHRADGVAEPLPGVAPVAMQQGRHVARTIRLRLGGRSPTPFRYREKGDVATIGRMRAVLRVGPLELSGVLAWLVYLTVHLVYLVGLQNRLLVLIRWVAGVVTRRRGARLITPDGGRLAAPRG